MSDHTASPAPGSEPSAEPATSVPRSRRARPEALAPGVLTSVTGYQIVQAQITTRSIYFHRVGNVLGLRPVEYSLLMLLTDVLRIR